MSLFSGARLTDRNVEVGVQKRVREIVMRLSNGAIDPPDANRLLVDLIVREANALARTHQVREGVEHVTE
jgi:hypothetical protein